MFESQRLFFFLDYSQLVIVLHLLHPQDDIFSLLESVVLGFTTFISRVNPIWNLFMTFQLKAANKTRRPGVTVAWGNT